MNKDCRAFADDLADVAEGRGRADAIAHVAKCTDCEMKVAQLRRILEVAAVKSFEAPATTVDRARAIFAPPKPVILARLALSGSAARSSGSTTRQFRREIDGVGVRLLIRPTDSGWHVMGEIEGPRPEGVTVDGTRLTLVDGQFEAIVDSLENDIWLEYAERLVRVPLEAEG